MFLILPAVLFVLVAPLPAAPAHRVEDFTRFSQAIGKRVELVDQSGVVRSGIVDAVTADIVTLRIGSATQAFLRTEVASAQRMKDSTADGVVKGLLVGLLMTAYSSQGYDGSQPGYLPWATVGAFTGIGFLLDVANNNPQPFYRAPARPGTTVKLSIRF